MKLSFTPRALRHLAAIADYLNERSPSAAGHVGERISETIELLAQFPELGHEGSLAGTRELVVPGLPCIVVPRIEARDPAAMTVLGIYHGAQLRPGQRNPRA